MHSVLKVSTKIQLASKSFFTYQGPLLPPVHWSSLLQPCGSFHALITSGVHPHQRLYEHLLDSFTCTLSDSLREHIPSLVSWGFPSERSHAVPTPHISHVCSGPSGDAAAQAAHLLCISMGFQHLYMFPLNQAGSSCFLVLSASKRVLEMT